MTNSIILNLDNSNLGVSNYSQLDLLHWQDRVRFGCTHKQFHSFKQALITELPNKYGTVLLGSGDFHHISWPLIEHLSKTNPNLSSIEVIVFDNHPDNMRYLFGIHCGSWVSYVAKLPFVKHIHVVGITSNDIGFAHCWENRLTPLLNKKLTYWSMDVNVAWAKRMGLGYAFRHFSSPEQLIEQFLTEQVNHDLPLYLSIDKDVLSREIVQTNWDQGRLGMEHLETTIKMLKHRVIGSDITGDISIYQYQSKFKRFLSALDKQPVISDNQLYDWQQQHQLVNLQLIGMLS